MTVISSVATAVLPHPPEWPVYTGAAIAEASALVARGRTFDYGRGPQLERLEDSFAALCGRRHALALNSGTSALFAGYFALGLGPGDEVLVPALTFPTTVTPLLLLGAVPVLCDAGTDSDSGNVTADTLRARITPRTRAISVTHLWGHAVEMGPVLELAKAHGLAVLEDCSHAHGSRLRGRPVGGFGHVAVFSVGGVKLVSGGLGGVLLTDDRQVYERACLLSAFRQRSNASVESPALRDYAETGLGGNLRMSPVACVLAQSHLDALDDLVARKEANVRRLLSGLTGCPGITPMPEPPDRTLGARYGVHLVLDEHLADRRREIVSRLRARGLKVEAPKTGPLHLTRLFRTGPPDGWRLHAGADWTRGPVPHRAEELWRRWIALPATYLHDAEGSIVDPYIQAIHREMAEIADSLRSAHAHRQ
jgi:perosamine synthetase